MLRAHDLIDKSCELKRVLVAYYIPRQEGEFLRLAAQQQSERKRNYHASRVRLATGLAGMQGTVDIAHQE
jgi:hypothetical protein